MLGPNIRISRMQVCLVVPLEIGFVVGVLVEAFGVLDVVGGE